MNNRLLTGVLGSIFVIFAVVIFYQYKSQPKIAFIRTAEVVNKFYGMKEAKEAYRKKIDMWQMNVDTLEADYQKSLSSYRANMGQLSVSQKNEKEAYLKKQEESIRQYVQNLEEKAKEEDQKMTEAVIAQINQYIEVFSKEQGYDVILGTNVSGTVLYGSTKIDVTNELIEHVNAKYLNK